MGPNHRRKQRVCESETTDRWVHDKFVASEQRPKTSYELGQRYGFYIRDESSAPRAARQRGYGRRPDGKTQNAQEGREKEFLPRKGDFPRLSSAQRPREQQNRKEPKKQHQAREDTQGHQKDNGRQPDRKERPNNKSSRRPDQALYVVRKDRPGKR